MVVNGRKSISELTGSNEGTRFRQRDGQTEMWKLHMLVNRNVRRRSPPVCLHQQMKTSSCLGILTIDNGTVFIVTIEISSFI